ncbi:S9 family peptidase [Neobacillus terrae]|uniref:S9 family peptidase n=1 Tax=Neobacillus terrae TaxID=3034837 RepID=UPI001409F00C|nr:S9 family peptidase [Neobacillus terrae]NHM31725.1 S9 family peptidase [Neobacillus terrae]
MSAEDLYELNSVSDPRFSPDNNKCVFVQTGINKETDDYFSHLFILDMEKEGEAIQLTYGKSKNHSPRWSLDGKSVAFVSNREGGKNQIFVLSINGGEARQVTELENGASNPVWSPDGKRIAFLSTVNNQKEPGEKESDKKLLPLEVGKMKYKSDASGFWKGTFHHVSVVDVVTGEVSQLTEGENDFTLYSWSPDGKNIAVGADLETNKDQSFIHDIYLLDPESKGLSKITNGTGSFGNVTWSPDGKFLAAIGQDMKYYNATLSRLWIYDLEAKKFTCFTEGLDLPVGDFMAGDFQQGAVLPGAQWTEDSSSFYFVGTDNGNTVLYYGNLDGEIYPALLDQQHIFGFTLDSKNQRAVLAISRPSKPSDLFLLNITEGTTKQLTDVNKEILSKVELSEAKSFEFEASDGWKVQGWLMLPIGYEEGKQYPMVLEIHGGPHAMYGNTYMHEFQLLASKGYAVLFINPRGSHGYGQKFVNAVRGDYGGKDYQDIMDAVDYVLDQHDFIDDQQLFVTGGSYGGFMTNWIVGHTNRFKAAVTQRSISNWISFYGVSDIGYYFTEWQIESDLSDIEKLWKHSPLAYVKNVETPLLILHSEKDYRCPIEQGEQLFIALKRLEKPAKMIRFPEENHELSRSGKPSLRIYRLNYIADWFGEYTHIH